MRLIDANARVEKIITGNKNTPFVFGEWDCCIYFSAIVMALLGDDQDPMKEFRGKYDDQKSAIRALREIGEGSINATLKKKFGDPIHRSSLWRYDCAATIGKLGIVLTDHALFLSENGFARIKLNEDMLFYAVR